MHALSANQTHSLFRKEIMMIRKTEQRPDNICFYELENDKLKVLVSSYGVTLIEIDLKDAAGNCFNTILGYPTIEDYIARSGTYFGALVGRTCNRLKKGQFTLNGKDYQIAVNNGPNSLHGGIDGFSYQNFDSRIEDDQLIFTYHSPDMEEGYPGNLDLTCTLKLEDNALRIIYDAISDQDTLCNLTHHTYFNLNQSEDVSNHLLRIDASRHGLVDPDGLCIGHYREVQNTPLDFRQFAPIHQGFDQSDEQVQLANGIDHHFVLDDKDSKCVIQDPVSKRTVEIETTLPGIQLYSGNFIEPSQGRHGVTYSQHAGLAVEPQFVPDSIHNQEHPDVILKANQPFHEEILYRFFDKENQPTDLYNAFYSNASTTHYSSCLCSEKNCPKD